jgi:thioredoxin reductase (NADPH)
MGAPPGRLRLFGTRHSRSAYEIRDFLTRSVVEFDWTTIETDAQCQELLGTTILDSHLPIVEMHDGTVLRDPTIDQIARRLGWVHQPRLPAYDVSIYGAGPAGLSAAVYAASEGLKVVVVEREAVGGQAGTSSLIENYLGFPSGVRGSELAERARQQAVDFGAEILLLREGVRKEWIDGKLSTVLADGAPLVSTANICATGVEWRRLGLPGEERLLGSGLYYGSGTSEAPECEGEDVYIVGGANSAGQAAMNMAAHAASVTMLVRGERLSDTMSSYLVDRIAAEPRIRVRFGARVAALLGGDRLHGAAIDDADGRTEVQTGRLFVCIGGAPNTEWASITKIARDDKGFVVTGPDLTPDDLSTAEWPLDRAPFYLESSIPGAFAAGDVRHSSVKRVASAVGEGAMAVTFVHRYLAELEGRVAPRRSGSRPDVAWDPARGR